MDLLLGLAAVLAVVAVVGHGLWVVAATLLRALFAGPGRPADRPPRRLQTCPACGANAPPAADICLHCGLDFDTPVARQLGRIRTAQTEVDALAESGDLDAETAKVVSAQFVRRAREIRGLPADPPRPVPAVLAPLSVEEPQPAASSTTAPSPPEPVAEPSPPASPPATPPPPAPPRRGSVVAAFLEERNILWGELAGGLLIVGCSIALLATLWNRLEAIPYFPFFLSGLVTLALYGAGQYTRHHWKLAATSLGLLVITLLLVPLDLLLLSDPITRAGPAGGLAFWLKVGAVLLFAWVVRGGGRDVLPTRAGWRWPLALTVVGAPAALLLPAGWLGGWAAAGPLWLGLGCFAGGCAVALRGGRADAAADHEAAADLLRFVGLAAFALAAAWGLHVAGSTGVANRMLGLAVPLALAGAVVVEVGLAVSRLARDGGLRVVGTGVGLAGVAVMTTGLAASWPDPAAALLVSLLAGLFLTRVAFRDGLPLAHAAALPALGLAAVLTFHGFAGHWPSGGVGELLRPPPGDTLDPDAGLVLAGFALVLAAVAEWLARRGTRTHAVAYAVGAAVAGGVGLFLVSVNGPGRPVTAAATHAAVAVGLLASNMRWRLRILAHGGLWVILVGSLWALYAGLPGRLEVWATVVAAEAFLFAGLAVALENTRTGAGALLRRAGRDVAIAAAVLTPALMVYAHPFPDTPWDTATLFVLAAVGLVLARLTGRPLATYAAAAVGYLGFVHLGGVTSGWEPVRRALLVCVLAHATLAAFGAIVLRRRERVFAYPLRTAAKVTSVFAAVALVAPAGGLAGQWAGCAVWLGLVWLVVALARRDPWSFAAFQAALSLAAVLGGVAWIDAQDWRPALAAGYFEPAGLHAYAVALGFLTLGWAVARRLLCERATARELWVGHPWSAERVALGAVVVGQVLLAASAVVPAAAAELIPVGQAPSREYTSAIAQAFGPGAWLALAVTVVALVASWRLTGDGRDTDAHLVGLTLVFLTGPVVWAGAHAADTAAATALRWGFGVAFALGTGLVALRTPLRRGLGTLGFPAYPTPLARSVVIGLLAVAAGVVVCISANVAELGIAGKQLAGPAAESAFAAMGPLASNLVPLSLVVLGLGVTAARERSPGYAFAGGLVFTATAAAGYALGVTTAGGTLDGGQLVRVALLACGSAAVWAAAWLAAERRVGGGALLAVQSWLGLAGLACLAAVPALALTVRPQAALGSGWGEFGRLGWVALVLAGGAAVGRAARAEPGLKFHALVLAAVIAGVLAACAVQPWDATGTWLSAHVLGGAWALVGVGLVVTARRRGESSWWLDALGLVLALLAARGGWDDPARPWAPAALALVASVVVGAAAVLTRGGSRVIASGLLVNLAAILLWLPTDPPTASGFMLANAAGLALAAAAWTAVGFRIPEVEWRDALDLSRGLSLVLLMFGLSPTFAGDRTDPAWLTWGATGAVSLGMLAALWDRNARIARGGLFAAGAGFVLLAIAGVSRLPVWDEVGTPPALAGYALLTAGIGVWVARRAGSENPFRIPVRGDHWGWLVAAQGVVAALVVLSGVRLALIRPELDVRLSAGPITVLTLVAAAALLLQAVPTWAGALRFAVVGLGVLALAATAWAVPDPAAAHVWLHRNAWLFVALAAAGVLGSERGAKLGVRWRAAVRAGGGAAAGLAVVTLGVNLAQQVPVFDPVSRHTPLGPAAVFAMLAGTAALVVLAVRCALRRTLDPLNMPDDRRTRYVYLAEVLVVLCFTQARFNVPELFVAGAVKYWTFAVMGLAFVVVGLAELFERRKLDVLATPLRRTGLLLPLLPLLAFWAKPPAALGDFAAGRAPGLGPLLGYLQNLPRHFDTYAALWFLAGGLYGLVALWRNSFGWALLGALATNAAVWALLTHHEVPFAVHPQAWVVPLALIVLVSEHVNRHRLRAGVSNGLRYLGVGMIYVASAADMFIAGVGQSVWLPVVLAVFCVLGVLAGILLRVRAFVVLGIGFLGLDVFAMIWHAAVDLRQTWVWYASGIGLGVAILAVFAVFEKRKRHAAGEGDGEPAGPGGPG